VITEEEDSFHYPCGKCIVHKHPPTTTTVAATNMYLKTGRKKIEQSKLAPQAKLHHASTLLLPELQQQAEKKGNTRDFATTMCNIPPKNTKTLNPTTPMTTTNTH
jgi:hypothetical protein